MNYIVREYHEQNVHIPILTHTCKTQTPQKSTWEYNVGFPKSGRTCKTKTISTHTNNLQW